jgi:hypothetical protein
LKPTPIQSSSTIDGESSGTSDESITTQRSRLKGVFYTPSNIAGTTRVVELKDNSSGDVLFSFWAFMTDPTASNQYPADTVYLEAQSNGIVFPDGIKITKNVYFTELVVLYQG